MPKRILVIDDDERVRKAFTMALYGMDYEVATAASGQDGLDKANAAPPDLIFLDLRMPGMDGVEVLKRLQGPHSCCANVPVYIVTAFRKQYFDPLQRAIREGCNFSVADKPLSDDQIRSIARGVLEGGVEVER